MDTTSTPVKKKPKTLPKPILEPHNSSFSGNKDVNPLESLISPTIHPENLTESSANGKTFQVLGQKPPLLPKPKNLKKTTFSSPHRHHHKILTSTDVSDNSNVRSVIDFSFKSVNSTVTEVASFSIERNHSYVHDSITCMKTGIESVQYEKDNDGSDVIFNPDTLVHETEDCKNMYTASIIDELKPDTSESQILSHKEFINERSDNIAEAQTDVERIVANTWAALQEDSGIFSKTVNIKSNNSGKLSLNSSDISNKSANDDTLILSKTTTCPSLSQDSSYGEEKSKMNKTQSVGSIGELVRALHTVKVENSDASDRIIDRKDSGNESFLHRTKVDKNKPKNETENVSFIQQHDTSISKLPKECSGYVIDYNLDTGTNKHDKLEECNKLEEHNRSASWSEETSSVLSRSNSIGSGSYDGPNTVRRRFSTWLGSFGKGSKQKEARESCLFYYDHSEADDSTVKQNEEITISQSSLNDTSSPSLDQSNKLNLLKVPQYSSSNFDDDSNRSSVSDESFDVKHGPKIESENRSSNSVQITVQDKVEKKKQKCYFIAKELVSSEKVFIDVLKLLCEDFKSFIEEIDVAQKTSVIPMNDLNRIINTLPLLLDFNKDLLRDFQSRIDFWSDLPKIADVIVKKGPFLKLYITYIKNFQVQTNYLDECCQKYPRFLKAVKDFEASDRCKKLALKHYMLKPIQRIPQYRLLLEDYLEHQEEGSVDYADTRAALEIVRGVALAANKSIAQGDNLSKLLSLQSQLGNYEIIKPGREFVMEGELYKLSRKEMQLRFFILLSDCLLYTSYYGSMTGLRVKNKLPLSGMKVNPAHDKDSPTEFSIITSTRSFTLRAKSEEECEAWLNALQNAIQENNSRQMTFLNMNFIPMNAADEPLKLGREAPVWIPDKRVTMCQVCTSEFTVTFRRHHCRACGKVVCGSCSDYKAPLQYKEFQPCRVCEDCFEFLLKELDDNSANMLDVVKNEFHIEEDSALANMVEQIRSSFKKPGPSSGKKVKKYIPQRLKEVTANDSGSRMSGWLYYRRSRRSWKRLWFVLKEQVLYVYKASEDVVALETIPVLGYTVDMFKEGEYEESIGDCRFVFQLTHAGQFPFVFSTDTQQSAERWISAIREATLLT